MNLPPPPPLSAPLHSRRPQASPSRSCSSCPCPPRGHTQSARSSPPHPSRSPPLRGAGKDDRSGCVGVGACGIGAETYFTIARESLSDIHLAPPRVAAPAATIASIHSRSSYCASHGTATSRLSPTTSTYCFVAVTDGGMPSSSSPTSPISSMSMSTSPPPPPVAASIDAHTASIREGSTRHTTGADSYDAVARINAEHVASGDGNNSRLRDCTIASEDVLQCAKCQGTRQAVPATPEEGWAAQQGPVSVALLGGSLQMEMTDPFDPDPDSGIQAEFLCGEYT